MRIIRTTPITRIGAPLVIDTLECHDGEVDTTNETAQLRELYDADAALPSYARAERNRDELRDIPAHPVAQRERFIELAAETLTQ